MVEEQENTNQSIPKTKTGYRIQNTASNTLLYGNGVTFLKCVSPCVTYRSHTIVRLHYAGQKGPKERKETKQNILWFVVKTNEIIQFVCWIPSLLLPGIMQYKCCNIIAFLIRKKLFPSFVTSNFSCSCLDVSVIFWDFRTSVIRFPLMGNCPNFHQLVVATEMLKGKQFCEPTTLNKTERKLQNSHGLHMSRPCSFGKLRLKALEKMAHFHNGFL